MSSAPHRLPDPRRSFGDAAAELLARPGLSAKVQRATDHAVRKLALLAAEDPRWPRLKDHAAAIKRHALTHLDRYLEQFIAAVESRGGHVHFAADAAEARTLVCEIARAAGSTRCIKAKSMATEEIDLNPALAAAGVEVVETDVGEMIIQVSGDRPSHLTAPAIHLSVDDVDAIYRDAGLRTAPPAGAAGSAAGATFVERATFLSLEARRHLRPSFLSADLGISGANLLVADGGAVILVENEGNIRLSTTVPRVHIVVAGPEKMVATLADAGVVLSLLAPSATGQRQSSYVSVIAGPLPERELHVVLLDSGRLALLGDPELYDALTCLRCGACLNHCPVYRQVGGHAYGHEVPGPIGKILQPHTRPASRVAADLPFASSLCGACGEVCPVRIPIPRHLLALRRRLAGGEPVTAGAVPPPAVLARRPGWWKRQAFRTWARWMTSPRGYRRMRRAVRWSLKLRSVLGWLPPMSAWTARRELPELPEQTFREWWASR